MIHDFIREFFFGRHLIKVVVVADCLEQQTFFWIIQIQDWTGVTALLPATPTVKQKTGFGFTRFIGVTFVTVFHQDRANVFLKEIDIRSDGTRIDATCRHDAHKQRDRWYRPWTHGTSL